MLISTVQSLDGPLFSQWIADLYGNPVFNVTITQPERAFWKEAGPLLAATVIGGLITLASGYLIHWFQSKEISEDRRQLWKAEVSKRQHAEVHDTRIRLDRIASLSRQLARIKLSQEMGRLPRLTSTSDNLDSDFRQVQRFARNQLPSLAGLTGELEKAISSLRRRLDSAGQGTGIDDPSIKAHLEHVQQITALMVDKVAEVESRFDNEERYTLPKPLKPGAPQGVEGTILGARKIL